MPVSVCFSFFIAKDLNIVLKKLSKFSHEKPSDPDDPLSTQNIRDRYYGSNDPVAEKILNRAKVSISTSGFSLLFFAN